MSEYDDRICNANFMLLVVIIYNAVKAVPHGGEKYSGIGLKKVVRVLQTPLFAQKRVATVTVGWWQ